jgi:hypothetical protein
MKLKYKKIILLTTVSTMGIGLMTLSINHDKTNAQNNISSKTVQEAASSDVESDGDIASLAITVSPTPSQIPSPTALPVFNIEKDNNPEIKQLFKNFYEAKDNHNVNGIKKLLSDPNQADTKEELKKKTQYIESYSNIKTYVKKGYEEGTYIVYVYHEITFTGIKTPAPGLSKFYVITDENKQEKIFSGTMDTATQEYYDQRNDDEDVKSLIDMTNQKSENAMKKDKDLKSFWKNINKLAKKELTEKTDSKAE